MASFRLPGVICGSVFANWIDLGTMCRSRSPRPGVINLGLPLQSQTMVPAAETLDIIDKQVQLSQVQVNDLDYLKVPYGQLTFDAEGNDDEGSIYFSRKPHVPSDNSGVTIGRGYDMGEKPAEQIRKEFVSAGITSFSESFSKAAMKKGSDAKAAIKVHNLATMVISRLQQRELFLISYAEIEADVKRICDKAEVIEKYGRTDWGKLDIKIKDVLVDLRFRGDYTGTSRVHIQKLVADNNLSEFKKVICNRLIWPLVPADRFRRRCDYIGKV